MVTVPLASATLTTALAFTTTTSTLLTTMLATTTTLTTSVFKGVVVDVTTSSVYTFHCHVVQQLTQTFTFVIIKLCV